MCPGFEFPLQRNLVSTNSRCEEKKPNYTVMGLQNWSTSPSATLKLSSLPPTNGAFEENVKRVHDLKQ
jgi:hypothetical protein